MLSLPPPASPVWLGISALAAWRLSAMICYDRGPFGIMIQFRKLLVRLSLHRLVTCFHCIAFWVSVFIVGVLYGLRPLSLIVAVAVSGAASITERWLAGGTTFTEDAENDK